MDPISDQICKQVLRWRGLGVQAEAAQPSGLEPLAGRTVLVTGSAGSIGGAIARRLAGSGVERLILLDMCEAGQFRLERALEGYAVRSEICLGDIADGPFVQHVFDQYRPNVVLHAAAYKHVPMLETHPRAALRANVVGTKRLAEAAETSGCERLVMVSTDKAVSPVGVMGWTKKLAEMYLRSRSLDGRCACTSVRFGNVIESSGNVFELFARQIAGGGPLPVTDPRAERYFMTLAEASSLVPRAATVGHGGDVLVLNMGRPVRIECIARKMAEMAGLDPDEAISLVGLRPGERLDERLYNDDERAVATGSPGISRAEGPRPVTAEMDRIVSMLEDAVETSVGEAARCLRCVTSELAESGVESGLADAI
ncbi:MAG: UDP-N-acetylglucosamine 4,6-dehydratase [Phycisphaerales bacterium JB060]